MQVEALLANNNLNNQQNNINSVNNLFETSDKSSVKDRLMIGLDSGLSFEANYNNKEKEEDSKMGEVKTNPTKISKENLKKLVNSLTVEDFNKYEELGIIPGKEDSGNIVTVSERIKIELMTYCEEYRSSATNVNFDDIKEFASDMGIAYTIANKLSENNMPVTSDNISQVEEALSSAHEIKNINEGMEGYLVKKKMEPSINNVYCSMYSGSQSIGTTNLSQKEWENVKPQVTKMMEEVGIEVNSESLNNSRWIIEHNLPLTVDNLILLEDIRNIDLNCPDEQLIGQIVMTMSMGSNAKDTLLINQADIIDKAKSIIDTIKKADDNALKTILANGNLVTIENLKKEYNDENPTANKQINIIEAKKQLEEIRLMMTLEAGVKMLNKGFQIEVKPLKDIINELENEKQEYYNSLYNSVDYVSNNEEIEQLNSVTKAIEKLRSVPNYMIGAVLNQEIAFTIEDTIEVGSTLKNKLDLMNTSYETLATTKRTDLGDSITKAFSSSTKKILEELGLESNENNNKAVRILAYNEMEISVENIIKVKQIAGEYSQLVENLKPKATAYLIANKINPMSTPINELNDFIESLNVNVGLEESKEEKYSEFLWKLDKEDSLSKEQRDAYIGVYRLLNMIEKDDYSAVGSLLKQGIEMNLKNLATAVKTKRAGNLDITVDKNVGEVDNTVTQNHTNLLNQLSWFENRYFKQVAKSVLDNAEPAKLKKVLPSIDLNISLEKFADQLLLEEQDNSKEITNQYNEQKLKELSMVKQISDQSIDFLLDSNQKVSPENLMAAANLLKVRKGLFNQINEEMDLEKTLKVEEIDDHESALNAFEDFEKEVSAKIEEKLETEDLQSLDLSKLKLIHASTSLLTNMSKSNYYHIPININSEICMLRLKIINDSEDSGKIDINLESELLGKISSELKVDNQILNGIILSDNNQVVNYMQKNIQVLNESLEETNIEVNKIDCFLHNDIKPGMWTKQSNVQNPTTRQLYQIAKAFVKTLKEWSEDIN